MNKEEFSTSFVSRGNLDLSQLLTLLDNLNEAQFECLKNISITILNEITIFAKRGTGKTQLLAVYYIILRYHYNQSVRFCASTIKIEDKFFELVRTLKPETLPMVSSDDMFNENKTDITLFDYIDFNKSCRGTVAPFKIQTTSILPNESQMESVFRIN